MQNVQCKTISHIICINVCMYKYIIMYTMYYVFIMGGGGRAVSLFGRGLRLVVTCVLFF